MFSQNMSYVSAIVLCFMCYYPYRLLIITLCFLQTIWIMCIESLYSKDISSELCIRCIEILSVDTDKVCCFNGASDDLRVSLLLVPLPQASMLVKALLAYDLLHVKRFLLGLVPFVALQVLIDM